MRLRSLELAGLVDRGINAGISDQFVDGLETLDVTNLGQNGRAGDRPNAGDRGDMLWNMLHQFGDGLVDLLALFIQQLQLCQQAAHFEMDGIGQEGNPHRLARLRLDFLGSFLAKATPAGVAFDLADTALTVSRHLHRGGHDHRVNRHT